MSTLTINLKHLYQRRGLWLGYIFLGFYIFAALVEPISNPRPDRGQFIGLMTLMFIVGLVAGVTALDIVVRPFSFCMPGHWRITRKYLFVIAIPVSFLAAQVFWLHPDLEGLAQCAAVGSAFFAGLTVFWAGISVSFGLTNVGAVIGWFVFVFFIGQAMGLHVYIERFIIQNPAVVAVIGLFSSVYTWIWLGKRDVTRKHCSRPWIGFFDAFNRDKIAKIRQVRGEKLDKAMRKAAPWAETLFINMMARTRGTARCVWAGLYTTFGPALALWKRWFPLLVFLTFMIGYMGPTAWFMLIFMPIMVLMALRLPLYSTMLTAAGRRERFISTAVQAVLLVALLTTVALIIAAALIPLSNFMPPIPIKERITLTVKPVDFRWVVVPMLIMPLAMTLHVVLYRRAALAFIAMMILIYITMFVGIICRKDFGCLVRLDVFFGSLLLCWGIYLLTLHRISRRRCLVGS